LTQSQADALRAYAWPGNVRELKNVIERAIILSTGDVLHLDLPGRPGPGPAPAPLTPVAALPGAGAAGFVSDAAMREAQRANLLAALEAADWRIAGPGGAAELLGVRPSTLADRVKTLGIRRPVPARRGRRPT